MALDSVTITDAQSVVLTIQPLDAAGQPTTLVGNFQVPTVISHTTAALVIGPVSAFPWKCTVSAASPAIYGVFTIDVQTTGNVNTVLNATGTVTVVSGVITSIVLVFGTPTP